jgi:germination protein M
MQCHEAQRAIPQLIDGLLDYEEQFAVRQHVNGCPGCRAVMRAYEQDEQALNSYVRQAPFAPVARNVIEQIERSRSPWWDAFRAGSYRLASVAGLLLVVLIVGAGAFMLREMATSDPETNEQPTQEVMIGTADDTDSETEESDEAPDEVEDPDPTRIGIEEADLIVDNLKDSGLVYEVGEISDTEAYSVEYGRIAFDRHLTLLEYEIVEKDQDARLMLGAFGTDGGGGADFSDDHMPSSGWLALPPIDPETGVVEIQDGETLGTNAFNFHQVEVNLSTIAELGNSRQVYTTSDSANGIDVCCLEIEHGFAVSTVEYDWNLTDQSALQYADADLNSVDSPPTLDPEIEPVLPTVTVDGEELPVLELDIAQALMLEGDGVGVLNLPGSGVLDVEYSHMTLTIPEDHPHFAIYEGPWTLSAQLEDVSEEPEATPEPEPTIPPDVAEEPTPTPVPDTGTGIDDEDEQDPLRVLVYMVRGEELGASSREIDYTQDVATASIEALLAGPDYYDEDVGLESQIPAGTELLDISLEDETLILDLSQEFTEGGGSASMLMRLAQVVHTGTQFKSVEDVQILIEGEAVETIGGEGVMVDEPLTREDFEDQAPAILIETPAPHDTVGEEIRLIGTSNTFEANLQVEIIDPMGNQIYRDYATATSGTGTRGEFDLSIPVDYEGEGIGAIRMFEHSARDGERTNVVTIPVMFE